MRSVAQNYVSRAGLLTYRSPLNWRLPVLVRTVALSPVHSLLTVAHRAGLSPASLSLAIKSEHLEASEITRIQIRIGADRADLAWRAYPYHSFIRSETIFHV